MDSRYKDDSITMTRSFFSDDYTVPIQQFLNCIETVDPFKTDFKEIKDEDDKELEDYLWLFR